MAGETGATRGPDSASRTIEQSRTRGTKPLNGTSTNLTEQELWSLTKNWLLGFVRELSQDPEFQKQKLCERENESRSASRPTEPYIEKKLMAKLKNPQKEPEIFLRRILNVKYHIDRTEAFALKDHIITEINSLLDESFYKWEGRIESNITDFFLDLERVKQVDVFKKYPKQAGVSGKISRTQLMSAVENYLSSFIKSLGYTDYSNTIYDGCIDNLRNKLQHPKTDAEKLLKTILDANYINVDQFPSEIKEFIAQEVSDAYYYAQKRAQTINPREVAKIIVGKLTNIQQVGTEDIYKTYLQSKKAPAASKVKSTGPASRGLDELRQRTLKPRSNAAGRATDAAKEQKKAQTNPTETRKAKAEEATRERKAKAAEAAKERK